MKSILSLFVFCTYLIGHSSYAVEPSPPSVIGIGDVAPEIAAGTWIQGEPVTTFDRDHAYLVEFWATWCGPCRATIPHLNQLHLTFKDRNLVVIGQNVWESSSEEKVRSFVKDMGDQMTYRVAMDLQEKGKTSANGETDGAGVMANTWMKAANQRGIPAAFLVGKDGRIAWLGHPGTLTEDILDKVLAGTWDTKAAAATAKAAAELNEKLRGHYAKLQGAMQSKNWDEAGRERDLILSADPTNTDIPYINYLIHRGKKDWAQALACVRQMTDDEKTNPMMLNRLSWSLLSSANLPKEGIDLAHELAVRANAATKGKDAAILDTLARAQFLHGDKDLAIATQQAAVQAAKDDKGKAELTKTLDSLKTGQLPPIEEE